MTTKRTDPDVETFGDLDEWESEDGDGWNGRSTDLVLARPLLRDQRLVATGKKIRVEASFVDGTWRGPEASHVRDLIRLGMIAGTPEAEERTLAQAEIDAERGVRPHGGNPDGLPGLKEQDTATLRRQHAQALRGGPDTMRQNEAKEVRSAVRELVETVKEALPALAAASQAARAAE